MPRFVVALVRFTENGRTYPVNGEFGPGDRVIVRMPGQPSSLRRAEVVQSVFRHKPCANTIVCLEKHAEAYGTGPEGVEDAEDLERFLGALSWRRCETVKENIFGDREALPFDEWPIAFVEHARCRPGEHLPDMLWGPNLAILVGRQGAGFFSWGEGSYRRVSDGKLGVHDLVRKFGKDGGMQCPLDENPYRHAAKYAERDLIVDIDQDDYPSLRAIRAEMSGGEDGPVYLSDGVWL